MLEMELEVNRTRFLVNIEMRMTSRKSRVKMGWLDLVGQGQKARQKKEEHDVV